MATGDVQASVALDGLAPIIGKFAGIAERLDRPQPALEIIANLLEAHVALQFSSAGARAGHPWRPLAAATVRARGKRWGYYRLAPTAGATPGGPPLTWSGQLRGSFRRGGARHIRQISAIELVWGSADPRARFHQSRAARTHLPRRPPIDFRDEFQQREIAFQPLRLWLQGVPAGAIETTMRARLGLGLGG